VHADVRGQVGVPGEGSSARSAIGLRHGTAERPRTLMQDLMPSDSTVNDPTRKSLCAEALHILPNDKEKEENS
jgi:hypothetical protein